MSRETAGPARSLPVLAAAAGALLLVDVVLVVAAVADFPWVFAAALVTAFVLQRVLEHAVPTFEALLRAVHLDLEARALVHTLALGILLAAHFEEWRLLTAIAVGVVLVGMPMSRAAVDLLRFGLRGRLAPPLETRNIDLGGLEKASVISPDESDRIARGMVDLAEVILLVGAAGVIADELWPFLLLGSAYDAALVGWVGWTAFRSARTRTGLSGAEWERRALERIRALRPEVILYFSGTPEAAYQVNMWLRPLAELKRSVLVVVRERNVLGVLDPTDLPIVCMPAAVSVMQAKLTTAKVALYVSHTSKNIHLLREPGMRHVFIGHGDSDKVSSINPFAKVYDEVWVAGPAGRDRWAAADVGVRDDAVVEVGRPQLEGVMRVAGPPSTPLTVLYAPTWEGWTDEDFGSSIVRMGPRLVRGLLATPDVRVVYKPHPLTGIRDPAALRSHREIVAMLTAAGGVEKVPDAVAAVDAALAHPGVRPAEHATLSGRWSQLFWSARRGHVVVDGPRPELFDCFNHSDLMVADVSSVVSDFLASGKPYVCANPDGVPEEQFRRENPSTAAAYLLGPDCAELDGIVSAVRGADPLAAQRVRVREYLLGPDRPAALERWRAAVDRLASSTQRRTPSGPGL